MTGLDEQGEPRGKGDAQVYDEEQHNAALTTGQQTVQ